MAKENPDTFDLSKRNIGLIVTQVWRTLKRCFEEKTLTIFFDNSNDLMAPVKDSESFICAQKLEVKSWAC